jgi:hypothetical protein
MKVFDDLAHTCMLGKLRLGLIKTSRRPENKLDAQTIQEIYAKLEEVVKGSEAEPCVIPLEIVREWTDGFSEARVVGEGAFGKVYEGIIVTEKGNPGKIGPVAVKRLPNEVLAQGGEKHLKREINVLR